jgi:uncharacterized DUF497 family protein
MEFQWDPAKAEVNLRKHGLSFEEAAELLSGEADYLEIYDDWHEDEDRLIAIGPIRRGVIVVVHTELLDDAIRIISARLATRRETQLFQSYKDSGHE